ncbi:MAG: GNAT family N-acetyltransferase [Bacteriovoracia bacterium]
MIFRKASNLDLERIRKVVFDTLREYAIEPSPESTDKDLFDLEESYFRKNGYFEVCEDNGQIVATWGILPLSLSACELRKMYLLKSHRGKGIGKTLLDRALSKARELGFIRVELETASELKEAISMYEKRGFKLIENRSLSFRCDQAYELIL